MRETTEIRRAALHDTIQERIERFILDSGAQPGDPLPPQQELARALGISVPSLREAMKSLETLGTIEVRHGSGTYVGNFSLDAMVDGLAFRLRLNTEESAHLLGELLDIRMILEQAYVRRVIEFSDDEHISGLYAIVDEIEAKVSVGEGFIDEDWRFHELLYRPMGNTLLTKMVRAFWDVIEVVQTELVVAPIHSERAGAEHRAIVDAVAARDPEEAAEAMEAHFVGIRVRLDASERPPAPIAHHRAE